MKIDFILDAIYLFVFIVCFIISVITGKSIVESGWSFFFGATVALAARNVINELSQRAERRQNRRSRLR